MMSLEDFVNVEKISSGSYSSVYKAQRKSAQKDVVAIKVVEKAKLSIRGKCDIVNEIELLKLFKHRHILDMKQFELDEKNIYIIMEYCDGGDLSTYIEKRCKLPENTCQKLLQQLAIGLQFLRSHEISHLDLKPQNLLLVTQPKLTLKIGDFGIARFLSDTTQKYSIRGLSSYMAPEKLLDGKCDANSDLWSVGVITYECLFGKVPFLFSTYYELYARMKYETPLTIPENTKLSKNCQHFLKHLLVYDPKVRMSYETFFNHPFLDLKHAPSVMSPTEPIETLCKAVAFDKARQYTETLNLYFEALSSLFPMTEVNAAQSTSSDDDKVYKIPLLREILLTLCSKSPNLMTALKFGMSAQMYFADGKYQRALELFVCSLHELLITFMSEPAGIRRELLYVQMKEWLDQAESANWLLLKEEDEGNSSSAKNKGKKNKKIGNRVISILSSGLNLLFN